MGASLSDMRVPIGTIGAALGDMRAPIGTIGASLSDMRAPIGATGAPLGDMRAPIGTIGAALGDMRAPIGAMDAPLGDMRVPIGAMGASLSDMRAPIGLGQHIVYTLSQSYTDQAKLAPMLSGSCMCGGVAYETSGPLIAMTRCHCVQCRKASGAEFATNASVAREGFRVTRGEELLARYESSPGRRRVFCKRCGSPVFKEDDSRPYQVRLRLGCLDSELDQQPMGHLFVGEKPRWSEITDGLPQYQGRPDGI